MVVAHTAGRSVPAHDPSARHDDGQPNDLGSRRRDDLATLLPWIEMKTDRKTQAFRVVCILNGVAMVSTGLYGVFWPAAAMNVMTGYDHVWDPQTLSLMRMHNGADFGLGVGFVLAAWRPQTSFAAFVLCLFANVAHGL